MTRQRAERLCFGAEIGFLLGGLWSLARLNIWTAFVCAMLALVAQFAAMAFAPLDEDSAHVG